MKIKIYTGWRRGYVLHLRWRYRPLKVLLSPQPKGKPPVNYSPLSFWRDYFDHTQNGGNDGRR